jgi:hypothetical protein
MRGKAKQRLLGLSSIVFRQILFRIVQNRSHASPPFLFRPPRRSRRRSSTSGVPSAASPISLPLRSALTALRELGWEVPHGLRLARASENGSITLSIRKLLALNGLGREDFRSRFVDVAVRVASLEKRLRKAACDAAVEVGCNACHATTDHSFIVIKAPEASAFPNQEFAPK